jgi:hypothetical protein
MASSNTIIETKLNYGTILDDNGVNVCSVDGNNVGSASMIFKPILPNVEELRMSVPEECFEKVFLLKFILFNIF